MIKNVKSKYSLLTKTKMAWWLLRTKLIDRHARFFRFPIDIRGRENIDFGIKLTTGVGCRFECYESGLGGG